MTLLTAALVLWASPVDVCPPKGFDKANEPTVAVDRAGSVYVAFGQGTSIYFTSSTDRGQSFAKPQKVAEVGALALGMRRGPRIAVNGRTVVISAIAGKANAENLYAWASPDEGKSWRAPIQINDEPTSAREGLHAMAASGNLIACAWLDLRATGTRLYMSSSPDGVTWSENIEVYQSPGGSICECCHPSLGIDNQGRPSLMWRNSLEGNRDMFFLASRNGRTFDKAQKLGDGSWKLGACPMDGGAIAFDAQGRTYTAWRRESTIYTCEPGKSEVAIGQGEQPWLAVGEKGPVVAWLEKRNGKLLVKAPGDAEPRVVSEKANDPVLASAPGGKSPVILVWVDANSPGKIRSLVL